MMSPENRKQAIEIISKSNSIKVSFNVPVKDNYSNIHEILIHESNASVINELVNAGFSLFPTKKGISVTKL